MGRKRRRTRRQNSKLWKPIVVFFLIFFDIGFLQNFHRYNLGNKIFTVCFIILSTLIILYLSTKNLFKQIYKFFKQRTKKESNKASEKEVSMMPQEPLQKKEETNPQEEIIMYEEWYLKTPFICLLFAFSFLIVPAIVGVALLLIQNNKNNKLIQTYGHIHDLKDKIASTEQQIQDLDTTIRSKEAILQSKKENIRNLYSEISNLEKEVICKQYVLADYDGLTSEECKNKLALLKNDEQADIKDNGLLDIQPNSLAKKTLLEKCKQITREFNTECDNALLNLTCKKIDTIRGKITKAFEILNKSYSHDCVQLSKKFLEYKLEELNLVYTYELKKEQEREQQRAIKEQMIEEEKVRKEIERQKGQIEKDQTQCNNEINRLMSYMQKTESDVEKQLYVDKIKELEERLKALEANKATVLEREANARAGYVYIISNIGSFGEDVYKIGMTRRLEPMDRIKELSSASVPFEFDVHAMIFSDDAPALETALHQKFEKQSVNRINLRKEFFKVTLDEIEEVVKKDFNNTTNFTRLPVAKEYYETLDILKAEAAS